MTHVSPISAIALVLNAVHASLAAAREDECDAVNVSEPIVIVVELMALLGNRMGVAAGPM